MSNFALNFSMSPVDKMLFPATDAT